MYTRFLVNWTKIEGFIASRRGCEILLEKQCEKRCEEVKRCENGLKNGTKNDAEKFPTDCFQQINRKEWRPSGFMKKMNGDKYKVTRIACDNGNHLGTFSNKLSLLI